jgi:hypothetical protein
VAKKASNPIVQTIESDVRTAFGERRRNITLGMGLRLTWIERAW